MPELIDTSSAVDLLYPLNEFYGQEGFTLPAATRINGREMPEPYRHLLVHDRDMTPTLEAAYDRKMNLRVLKYALDHEVFSRQILLLPEDSETPVILGSIKIYLDEFPTAARELVLERRLPLGTILESQAIRHFSAPDAFFEIDADAWISESLGISGPARLYGRRNVLGNGTGRKLAQVLEILPPASRTLFPEKSA
jgi:chorismate-pyruvate lyase